MKKICIMCPMGCSLNIEEKDGQVVVTGNTCRRGQIYGTEEYTHPKRTITTLCKRADGGVVSCKTTGSVDKYKMMEVVKVISTLVAPVDAKIGDILLENICNQNVNVVVTGTPE